MAEPMQNGIVHVSGPEKQTVVVAMLNQNELDVAEESNECSWFCLVFISTFVLAFGIPGIALWSAGLIVGFYFLITAGVCLLMTMCLCLHLKIARREVVEKYMQRNDS